MLPTETEQWVPSGRVDLVGTKLTCGLVSTGSGLVYHFYHSLLPPVSSRRVGDHVAAKVSF